MRKERPEIDCDDALMPRTILIVAPQTDLLTDCLKDVLQRFLPRFQIIVRKPGPSLLQEMSELPRLVICYRLETALIAEMARRLRRSERHVAIGIFGPATGPREVDYLSLAKQRLIDGIFPSATRLDIFLIAVDLMLKGGEFFPLEMIGNKASADRLPPVGPAHGLPEHSQAFDHVDMRLTSREREILDLMSKGTQNKIIAARLDLSENTVKVHVRSIYRKMHVRNRTEAVSQLLRHAAQHFVSPHAIKAPNPA